MGMHQPSLVEGERLLRECKAATCFKVAKKLLRELKKCFTLENLRPILLLSYFDPTIASQCFPKFLEDDYTKDEHTTYMAGLRC